MVNTTLCYLARGQEYLMLHRVKKDHDINHGKWIGVGGKFEFQESPEDCLLREVREETGLVLTRWQFRGVVTFCNNEDEAEYMHLFTADGWEGTLRDCDRIFLRLLAEDAPFFSLKLTYHHDVLVGAVLNGVPMIGEG